MVNKFVFTTNLHLETLLILMYLPVCQYFHIGEHNWFRECPVKKDKTQNLATVKDILSLKLYETQKTAFWKLI